MSAELSGVPVAKGRVQIGAWGRPWADIDLTEPAELSVGSAQTLAFAGESLAMTVVSGGALHGRAAYHLVCGAGWSTTVKRKSYANESGVKVANVLRDAAQSAGETITGLPTTKLGPHYARFEGPAYDVLNALAPRGWYVDFAGTTRIGGRATTTYDGDAPRIRVDLAAQIAELAPESVVGLVPGVVVDGLAPASDVEWSIEPNRLTVRVWGGPSTGDRLLGALETIIRAYTDRYRYCGVYEYRVATQSGERLNLQIVRKATGLDDLSGVPVRPGMAGHRADVQLGSLVLVAFVDGDASRPVVVAHDAPDAPGWMPIHTDIGGPGAMPIAYQGSLVVAGGFGGTVTLGSTLGSIRP